MSANTSDAKLDIASPMPRPARPARPSRPSVPALASLQNLDRCHHQMVEVLADLTQLVDRLAAQGSDAAARAQAATIWTFFATTARQHHADEETLVFPLLIQSGDPALTRHVLRLQQDHGWLEEDWLDLAPQVQAVALGYSGCDLDHLRQAAGAFSALYHDHVALEETLIYPEARRQMALHADSRAACPPAGSATAATGSHDFN
jgi:hemerythrin-like domain-containing protein